MEAINALLDKPLWSVVIGSAISAAVTWLAAWWYYGKAGQELRTEAAHLRRATDLVLYCLTNKDAKVTPNYDTNGHVCGLAVSASGIASMSMKATATASQSA